MSAAKPSAQVVLVAAGDEPLEVHASGGLPLHDVDIVVVPAEAAEEPDHLGDLLVGAHPDAPALVLPAGDGVAVAVELGVVVAGIPAVEAVVALQLPELRGDASAGCPETGVLKTLSYLLLAVSSSGVPSTLGREVEVPTTESASSSVGLNSPPSSGVYSLSLSSTELLTKGLPTNCFFSLLAKAFPSRNNRFLALPPVTLRVLSKNSWV